MIIKNLIFFLSIVSLIHSQETTYECKQHPHSLTQTSIGYEHINHKLLLDNKILIKELFDEMWFIKKISCTSNGFKINANHRQYGDLSEKTFILLPQISHRYKIISN